MPRGVLLYYRYTPLHAPCAGDEVEAFMRDSCEHFALRGRCRVARDGVNCTLGGEMAALRLHADAVAAHPLLRPAPGERAIDFKFASAASDSMVDDIDDGETDHGSEATAADAMARESKFDRLVVRRCAEVVSFSNGADPTSTRGAALLPSLAGTAPHASPADFHRMLVGAGGSSGSGSSSDNLRQDGRETVLIDVRNLYESRIGTFEAPGVRTLRPPTRVFSDFPAWVDRNVADGTLRSDHRILMCCTGGVRCERASAYLRTRLESRVADTKRDDKSIGSKGGAANGDADYNGHDDSPVLSSLSPASNVVQLDGGIVRYLEAFPDGGCFRGVNFVFDERGTHDGGSGSKAEAASAHSIPSAELASTGFSADEFNAPISASASIPLVSTASSLSPPLVTAAAVSLVSLPSPSPRPTALLPASAHCSSCHRPHADYRQRARCPACRALVLLCDRCHAAGIVPPACEICAEAAAAQRARQAERQQQQMQRKLTQATSNEPHLRILCLAQSISASSSSIGGESSESSHVDNAAHRVMLGRLEAVRKRLLSIGLGVQFVHAPLRAGATTWDVDGIADTLRNCNGNCNDSGSGNDSGSVVAVDGVLARGPDAAALTRFLHSYSYSSPSSLLPSVSDSPVQCAIRFAWLIDPILPANHTGLLCFALPTLLCLCEDVDGADASDGLQSQQSLSIAVEAHSTSISQPEQRQCISVHGSVPMRVPHDREHWLSSSRAFVDQYAAFLRRFVDRTDA